MAEELKKDIGSDIDPATGNFVVQQNDVAEDLKMKGDFSKDVYEPEFQEESRSESQGDLVGEKEPELTPELENAIMVKVKDINEFGTAFTTLTSVGVGEPDAEMLERILGFGVLGGSRGRESREDAIKIWKQKIKDRDVDKSKIWFNIVGRMKNYYGRNSIENGLPGLKLIFSIKSFEEMLPGTIPPSIDPIPGTFKEKSRMNNRFSSNPGSRNEKMVETARYYFEKAVHRIKRDDQKFQSRHREEDIQGFITPFRISPRIFEGLVLQKGKESYLDKVVAAMIKVDKDRMDRAIPIYDDSGNLLWPYQMSYIEVKQFVAERDKQQEESE